MIDLNVEVKASSYEEQQANMGGKDFPLIPEGTYDVKLGKFGEWELTTSQKGVDYYMADVQLIIQDGEYKGQYIFDTLRNHPATPWKASNFLGCFAGDDVSKPLSEFAELVGETGKVSVEHNEGKPKIEVDEFGLETEVIPVYANVKNYIVKEGEELTW